MKKCLFPLFILLLLCGGVASGQEILSDSFASSNAMSTKTDTMFSPKYKHSVGINVGWVDGLSLKFNLHRNVYLQADLGLALGVRPLYFVKGFFGPLLDVGYGGQIQVYAEDRFPEKTNTFWMLGGGVGYSKCFGTIPENWDSKFGIHVLLGIEWKFDIPLSLQLDFRPGCSAMFPTNYKSNHLFLDNSWFFIDYAFVFSVRYNFGK